MGFKVADQFAAVLVADEAHRVANHVHDARLHDSLRVDRLDGFREAFQAVAAEDEHVLDAARLELVDDLEPELRALRRLDPQTEHFLVAVHRDAERDVDALVAHDALVASLHDDRIEVDDGVDRVERPALPRRDVFHCGTSLRSSRGSVRFTIEHSLRIFAPSGVSTEAGDLHRHWHLSLQMVSKSSFHAPSVARHNAWHCSLLPSAYEPPHSLCSWA
jgi:hypothetical protein